MPAAVNQKTLGGFVVIFFAVPTINVVDKESYQFSFLDISLRTLPPRASLSSQKEKKTYLGPTVGSRRPCFKVCIISIYKKFRPAPAVLLCVGSAVGVLSVHHWVCSASNKPICMAEKSLMFCSLEAEVFAAHLRRRGMRCSLNWPGKHHNTKNKTKQKAHSTFLALVILLQI